MKLDVDVIGARRLWKVQTILMLPVAEREMVGSVLMHMGIIVRASPLQTFHRRVPRAHVSWSSSWTSLAGTAFMASQFGFHHGYF